MTPYTLAPLSYAYDALEPYIDAATMEIHHTRHHQAYVDNLNKAVEKYPELHRMSVYELVSHLDRVPADIRTAVQNHGGGHANHTFFWNSMKKGGGGIPKGHIAQQIQHSFGSYAQFQDAFSMKAKAVFGSGWTWLSLMPDGTLALTTTANQDSPLSQGIVPLLGLDVWEHAYYLKYQNKRPDYISAWWHVINWDQVEENFQNSR